MGRGSLIVLIALALSAGACSDDTGELPDVDAGMDAGEAAPPAPEMYTADRSLSPLTPYVVANLRDIIAAGPGRQANVFAKVGASATLSSNFMHCFDSGYADPQPGEEPGDIDLDGRDQLKDTIGHFRDGDAAGANPYERTSLATAVGWSAGAVLGDPPTRLADEYDAINPMFALIMFGTNDIQLGDLDRYGENLLEIADASIAAGVIPILSSIMPRDDDPAADTEVAHYNAVVRGVAQSRQVPFIDLHRELAPLADHGLGPDGIHPSVYRPDGLTRACVFDDQGLAHGYNLRNLLSIQTLDRMRRALIADDDPPDVSTSTLEGVGSSAAPFVIESLPFTHVADTSSQGARNVDVYDGCQANQNESGAELLYQLEVTTPTRLRASVIDRGSADIDVHLLAGGTGGDACVERAHQWFTVDVEPGTYYFSLDTFANSGGELSGEYLFTLVGEPM